jgi:ATP-dependent Lon protease
MMPGAVAPIHVARASSVAAVESALASTPPLVAIVPQRDAAVEEPGFADLHPIGCAAAVKKRIATETGTFVVLVGQWWASLEAVDPPGERAFATAVVRPFAVGEDLPDAARDTLVGSLRERAHQLARAMPQPERVVALVDSIRVPTQLADLIVTNLPCPVDDKVRYAATPTLGDRLRAAIALCDAQLAAASR